MRPSTISLNQKEQKRVLSVFSKETKSAVKIAETLSIPRRQVMAFLESKRLVSYSDGSYA
jgi:hypothetical protein